MKKVLILSLVLMLVLAACGKSGDSAAPESTAAPEQSATDTSAPGGYRSRRKESDGSSRSSQCRERIRKLSGYDVRLQRRRVCR